MWSDVSDDTVDFDEAVEQFRKLTPISDDDYEALTARAKRKAFKVAGVAQLDVVQDTFDAIDDAIANGSDIDDFKAAVGEALESAWHGTVENPGWRLETIFRTGVQRAYGEGRYRQATDPDTLEDREYWMFDAVMDDATTDECADCNGTVLPADDPWWDTHVAPLHFNAVSADTRILTKRGAIPAWAVFPGDVALTHKSRWRRITAALRKTERRQIRQLHLSTGRILRVTHEHPILVQTAVDTLVWRVAGDLQPGDHCFQHGDQVARVPHDVIVCDPHYAPTLGDEPSITHEVARAPDSRPVVSPVHLENHHRRRESQVDGILADRQLRRAPRKQLYGARFGRGWVAPHVSSATPGNRLGNAGHVNRVVVAHGFDAVGATNAPGPVIGSAALCDGDRVSSADCRLLGSRSHGDPVALAPGIQDGLADPQVALDGSNALACSPVAILDEPINGCPVTQVNWHLSTVVTAVDEAIATHELFDFSVDEDETYVAGGVLVHNCRSTFITLTAEQALQQGILEKGPNAEAAEGFGAAPTDDDDDGYEPDLSDYDPALRREFERQQDEEDE